MGAPFMATIPVLCGYTYIGAWPNESVYYGSKVIHVSSSKFIEQEFDVAMCEDRDNWSLWDSVGPKPVDWRLESYLPFNGLESF
jgi:hypothetical protein